jgi:hypothetical protein
VRDARWVWLAAGGLLVLGCAALVLWFLRESEPSVTGTVRLDGELLTKGSIAWIPDRGSPGPGGGGGISKEGKYEIKRGLRPGRYRVEIRSTRSLPRKVLNPTIPSEHEEWRIPRSRPRPERLEFRSQSGRRPQVGRHPCDPRACPSGSEFLPRCASVARILPQVVATMPPTCASIRAKPPAPAPCSVARTYPADNPLTASTAFWPAHRLLREPAAPQVSRLRPPTRRSHGSPWASQSRPS